MTATAVSGRSTRHRPCRLLTPMRATTHSRSDRATGRMGVTGESGTVGRSAVMGTRSPTGDGGVGGLGPFSQLGKREPAFDSGHPQSFHDRFALRIRGADLAGPVVLALFVSHAPTIRRHGSLLTPLGWMRPSPRDL